MLFLRNIILLFTITALTGCATAVQYGYDSTLYSKKAPHELQALIKPFQDLRTPDEHDGTFSATKDYFYTQDKIFKKDIGAQVTKAVKKHLEKAKVFKKVEIRELNGAADDPKILEELKDSGFDILISGDLHHFYGYQSGKISSRTASMFGLAGYLTEAMANKKIIGGRASLGDVKVIDVKAGKILWQGNIDYDYEKKITFYLDPQTYAIEALKMVDDKLVRQVDQAIEGK